MLDIRFPIWKLKIMDHPLISYRRREEMTQAALAARLGVQPPAVCKWEKSKVPVERVLEIERITGIPRHELRPDIYPEPTEAMQ